MGTLARYAAAIAVLLFLFASSAVAQQAEHTIGASYRNVSLSEGNVRGHAVRVAGTRPVGLWTGVAAHAGYQFALNNTMRDAVRGDWTDYRAVLVGISGYFEPLWFRTGALMHRFRLGLGPVVRYQHREHPQLLAGPVAYEEGHISSTSNMGYDRRYQERLEGGGLEQEGVYTLFTMMESGLQVGTQMGASYRVHIKQFIIGVDGDLHLLGGESLLGYGLFVGVQW